MSQLYLTLSFVVFAIIIKLEVHIDINDDREGNYQMNSNPHVGRPRQPLLIGQRSYVLFAYSNKLKTQLDIAARIGVALPRVHRLLVERGLHVPQRHGAAAHTNAVKKAVRMYLSGATIDSIVQTTGVVVSELYKALHARNIPLRSKVQKEVESGEQ
jgi:hypothetical protein